MSKHFLLNKIHIYEKNHDRKAGTENYEYSSERGYWVNSTNTQPLVLNHERPLPSSKKHDIERGEDLK